MGVGGDAALPLAESRCVQATRLSRAAKFALPSPLPLPDSVPQGAQLWGKHRFPLFWPELDPLFALLFLLPRRPNRYLVAPDVRVLGPLKHEPVVFDLHGPIGLISVSP